MLLVIEKHFICWFLSLSSERCSGVSEGETQDRNRHSGDTDATCSEHLNRIRLEAKAFLCICAKQ